MGNKIIGPEQAGNRRNNKHEPASAMCVRIHSNVLQRIHSNVLQIVVIQYVQQEGIHVFPPSI